EGQGRQADEGEGAEVGGREGQRGQCTAARPGRERAGKDHGPPPGPALPQTQSRQRFFEASASWLWCFTRKHEEQTNSLGCLGTALNESDSMRSSRDRSRSVSSSSSPPTTSVRLASSSSRLASTCPGWARSTSASSDSSSSSSSSGSSNSLDHVLLGSLTLKSIVWRFCAPLGTQDQPSRFPEYARPNRPALMLPAEAIPRRG